MTYATPEPCELCHSAARVEIVADRLSGHAPTVKSCWLHCGDAIREARENGIAMTDWRVRVL